MRRWFAILIIVCIAAAVSPSGALAAPSEDQPAQPADTTANLDFLRQLGILAADTFDGTAEMTRGEFAQEAVRLLNEDGGAYGEQDSPYADVDSFTPGAGAILLLTQRNIISGYSDGSFRPEENMTTDAAAEAMVRLLGYSPELDRQRYSRMKAKLAFSESRPLTYADAAELFERTLESECVEYTEFGEAPAYSVQRTLLEAQFDLEERTGKVTANRFTSLEKPVRMEPGWTEISSERLLSSGWDISDLLGYQVRYFSRKNAGGEKELIYAEPVGTEIVQIDAENVIEFKSGVLRYESGRAVRTVTVPADADVIYNGQACPDYTAQQILPRQGGISLIRIGGRIETVLIEDIKDEIVSAVTRDKLYFESGEAITPGEFEEGFYQLQTRDGNTAAADSLKEGAVVSLKLSADRSLARLIVCTDTVTGTAEQISDDLVTVGGSAYQVFPYLDGGIEALQAGEQYVFSLNAYGRIMKARRLDSVYQFGYFIRQEYDARWGELRMGLLGQDGKLDFYSVSGRVRLNGSPAGIQTLFRALRGESGDEPQLIRYKLAGEGDIREVETACNHGGFTGNVLEEEAMTGLRISGSSAGAQYRYKTSTRTFNGLAPVDENTIIFFVKTNALSIQEKDFYTGSSGELVNDRFYTFDAYRVQSDSRTADAMVIYDDIGSGITNTTGVSVVLERSAAIDAEGTVREKLVMLKNNKELGYMLADGLDPEHVAGASGSGTYRLSPGDAVLFEANENGEIADIQMVYDVEEEGGNGFVYGGNTTGSLTDAAMRLLYGDVYDQKDGVLRVAKKDLKQGVQTLNQSDIEAFQGYSSCALYLCSKFRGNWKVQIGSVGDIIPYTHDPNGFSRVIVATNYGKPTAIIIYDENE